MTERTFDAVSRLTAWRNAYAKGPFGDDVSELLDDHARLREEIAGLRAELAAAHEGEWHSGDDLERLICGCVVLKGGTCLLHRTGAGFAIGPPESIAT
jgi:hypothetical protein